MEPQARFEFAHRFAPAERVLEIFSEYPDFGRCVRFLSKQDYRKYLHLVLSESLCGVSITTLSKEQSKEVQLGAAEPSTQIKVLRKRVGRDFEHGLWAVCFLVTITLI